MNRRLLSFLVAASLVLLMTGCGKNADDGSKNSAAGSGAPSSSSGGTTGTTGGAQAAPPPNTGGSSGSSNPKPSEPPKQAEKVTVGPLQLGEAAKVGPLTVVVKQIEAVKQTAGLAPGYAHVLVELNVKNEGSAGYTINVTEHFRMETPEGKKAPYNMQASGHKSQKLSGTLDQGQSAEGWLGHVSKVVDGKYKYQFIHPDYGDATWEFSIQ